MSNPQNQTGIHILPCDTNHVFRKYIARQDESVFHYGDSTKVKNSYQDTIIVQIESNSAIGGRYLQKESILIDPKPRTNETGIFKDLFFGVWTFSAMLVVISLFLSASRINMAVRSLFSSRHAGTYSRTFSLSGDLSVFLLSAAYYLLLANTISYSLHIFTSTGAYTTLFSFFAIIILFTGLLFYRLIIQKISAYIFSTSELTRLSNYNVQYARITMTILMLLAILFLPYSPHSIYFIVFLMLSFSSFFIIRVWRTIKLGFLNSPYPLFYFILYFCTLEIVPVLVLAKILFFSTLSGFQISFNL